MNKRFMAINYTILYSNPYSIITFSTISKNMIHISRYVTDIQIQLAHLTEWINCLIVVVAS